jgi:3-carboxy-cis,cis-muconate cycloisomerase
MLLVEGALARVQGKLGLIPQTAAAFIDRSSREVHIDPAALAAQTAVDGVPVPALVAAFRKAMEAPEHAQYLHWGATSQDIMDSALALRLRRLTEIWQARLKRLAQALGQLAAAHADLPMAARTYGQIATPTSFGAMVASWGQPVLRHHQRRWRPVWPWSRWAGLRARWRPWGRRARRCGRRWPMRCTWPTLAIPGTRTVTGWGPLPAGWPG